MTRRSLAALAAAAVLATATFISGCIPLMVGAAVGGTALVATDRRSIGAQTDDEAIELKFAQSRSNRYGDRVHVNVTSYNGIVLLTGEVPDAETKTALAEMARSTDRVRRVHDEVAVCAATPLSERTNDTYITSKVKARFVEQNRFSATHVKVVTERGVVYLMGLVRPEEAGAAAQIASSTTGVARVVKLFDSI